MFVSGLGSWDVGLVTRALDLSFGNWAEEVCLFLDLEARALDLSLQHWTCLFEAGPSAQLHS